VRHYLEFIFLLFIFLLFFYLTSHKEFERIRHPERGRGKGSSNKIEAVPVFHTYIADYLIAKKFNKARDLNREIY